MTDCPSGSDAAKAAKRAPTIVDIINAKSVRRLVMLTAYDAPGARIAEAGGVDMILVGDSVAMAVLGRPDTNSMTMDEMVHHARAVSSAARGSLVVADMPFLSYEGGPQDALRNAGRFFREAGIRAVKLEGGRQILPQVRALTGAGIPVMGHLGLTPQRAAMFGGFKAQARTAEAAHNLLRDALALQDAGCFSIVLECVPAPVAAAVTARLRVPTIGIGAGPDCDGQVLVFHDLLGLSDFHPRFAKVYADLARIASDAVGAYARDVREGSFPAPEHAFSIPPEEWEKWQALLRADSAADDGE
ncbi:MAG: 3-methyl-2-oxobutanoate hydroxymethyltransferase [Desulfovibrionaceae bacterium]|nr:3-methyl-2-oxobutanoate hydroxymethyltransferase [Desulfovibrionaceae bacterium]